MAVASLGAGSGLLTSTVIDQLKAADTAAIITPITKKVTLQQQKGNALNLLSSLLTTFKSSASALDNDVLYQKRSVSGTSSAVNVTADAGVSVQSFSISNTQMALNNVKESGAFSSTTANVSTGSGSMTLSVGSHTYNIDYTSATSLSDLKDSINNIAGSSVKASTLQVGANDYRLILTSAATGADQTITLADSTGGTLNTSLYASSKKIESQAFIAPTDTIASVAGNLTVAMGTNSYVINYDATTTLATLRDSINTAAGSTIASIDSNNKLVLQSNVAGSSTALTLTDNSANLNPKLTGYTTYNAIDEIQAARDSSFKFNGITLTRSSNEISDVIAGVKINLLQDSGSANISITQDTQAITDEMSTFVQNYNTLTSQLNDMTTSNQATGAIGIFNGDNSINSITRDINQFITSINSKGTSLAQFGIDLSQTGTMSFNSTAFNTKFNQDPSASETFFSGRTTVDTNGNSTIVNGLFTNMNALLDRYTSSNGTISTLTTGFSTELKSLNDTKTRSQALLDARYAAMTARFVQYDSIMTKLTNQFSSLSQQISMAANGK
ncbi:MAG: flagellar filament capping protein FliD [Sulfuricurvum sp.]|nr:flagellar filament capping protein FliD [Sulfuricurvum sp.]MDD5387011.1 flagellar filament capping protein FliD [Sulfuricurvum sp.]